ncbi:SAM-dependent methyltransferase, partial [Saccharomonospora xinjiangensis]
MGRSFAELVGQAEAAPVDGWGFSWLEGRASEQRPSWGYARAMAGRLAAASAALDIQTGGGEVLAEAPSFPPTMVATESWPPNVAMATQRLHPRGVVVVATPAAAARTLPAPA